MKFSILIGVALLIAGVANAAEPMKMKGFYIGMTKAEAWKVVRRDMRRAPEQFPVYGSHDSLYPGADSRILVRDDGGASDMASNAALFFQKDILKYFKLKQTYFDADKMSPDEFRQSILTNYPVAEMSCKGSVCSGKGPAGEQVNLDPLTGVEVFHPLPPPPPAAKPKFD